MNKRNLVYFVLAVAVGTMLALCPAAYSAGDVIQKTETDKELRSLHIRFNPSEPLLLAENDQPSPLLLAQNVAEEQDVAEDQVEKFKEVQEAAEEQRIEGNIQEDPTGTDPRGFSPKFMPYYRYTRLKNDLKIQDMTLFGMLSFNPRFAMTYEWAIAKYLDYSDVSAFQQGIKRGTGGSDVSGLPPAGLPPNSLEGDGDTIGMGDLGLRFFFKPEALEWGYKKSKMTGSVMFGWEMIFPTATKDLLGSESFILAPMLTIVHDTPTFGFIALMNFYDFTVFKDHSRDKVSRYRGRWFIMQPLTKPGPWYGGIYLLPELQPVYDFEEDHFSFWIGPELGKIITPGTIVYLKPGWGIDPDSQDREFTFELGWRWFF